MLNLRFYNQFICILSKKCSISLFMDFNSNCVLLQYFLKFIVKYILYTYTYLNTFLSVFYKIVVYIFYINYKKWLKLGK